VNTMHAPVRVAIAGYGTAGCRFHAPIRVAVLDIIERARAQARS
jgi:hypothetical protein